MKHTIIEQIAESIAVKQAVLNDPELIGQIERVAVCTVEAYRSGHKTLFAGNGGSAADAQHLAGEFVSRFYFDRPGVDSIALSTNTSIVTAIGNDYGYDRLFERQVQAQGVTGDVFFGISTSGNSKNIVLALEECRRKGIFTVGMTGQGGGAMKELCDECICVPSDCTPRIQEAHILIGHIVCCLVEEALFGHLKPAK